LRREILRRLCAVLLAAVLLSLSGAPVRASAADTPPSAVRVGYFSNGDFMHKTADGSYAGYDVEYYYTLAGYANWDIQFVEYASLNDALQGLKAGDIDMMSGLSRTEERVSNYLISSKKMCTAQIAVQTRADDDRFSPGDTDAMKNIACGILAGSNVITLFTDWCEENGLTPHIVEYDSLDQRNAALLAGSVDAIAGGSTIPGAQKIAEFPSLDLYFMLNRSRADLKAQVDRAMNILALENPSYTSDLFLKYFPASRNTSPSFSVKEKAYLAAHSLIRVGLLASDAPFSSKTAGGVVEGILPDYYRHLAALTGTDFICEPYESTAAALAALRAGEIDLIGKYGNNTFEANSQQVLLSVPYLQTNLVQITRAGTGAVASLSVPECNAAIAEDVLSAQGLDLSVQICTNSEQCFDLLKRGQTDSVVCTQPAATWLLSRNRSSDYVVLSFGGSPWAVVCALPYGENSNILRSIIDKAVTSDNGYINQLITSETLENSASLSTFFDRLPVSFLTGAVAVAVILLGIMTAALLILIRRRKAERLMAHRQAALQAAEDANHAKHAFFGAVSHDMRTPLNGIMGYTDLALSSDDPAQVRGYLAKIRTSGAVLCGLVDDTLVMSRMENGKYVLHPVPVSTSEILREVLEPVRALAAEKGVRLEESIVAPQPRYVLADRISVQKLLLNLLTNAVRYTPPGGTVTFTCQLDPPADGQSADGQPDSIFTVADTGAGISPAFLPRLFEPFAQEHPENADTSGSGMGLAIVRRIVDAMGGTIDVQSERGKGTVFTVRLHFSEAEAPAECGDNTEKMHLLKGKRALVCEDNALNMEILSTVLRGFGMEVTCASDGKAGVEAYAASTGGWFDAVLLDLRMPVMDGISAAQAIRALDRPDAKEVPILAVSADAFADDVEKCRAAGMNGHVAKPIDPSLLYRTLSELLHP